VGWKGWLAVSAVVWLLLRSTRPQWYEDLMRRAFAADGVAQAGSAATPEQQKQILEAADLAAKYMLPLGWVIRIAEVATGTTLEQSVQKVQAKVLGMGPPADTKPETLQAYKDAALSAAKT
jgi:hypothetical protein